MSKASKNTTAKERMLKKIRHALLHKRENPYPQFEEVSLHKPNEKPLAVLFAEQLTSQAGQFVYCESEVQLMENLLALIEERGLRKIHVWEPSIQAILDKYELPYYPNDEDMMEMEVGITTCEALVARQGSVMVSSANAGGRRLTIFPETHVVIAHSRQLVLDIKDALAGMQRKYGAILPSSISFITGPSRTADIEKTLVFGAHGPKALYVFLMDY